MFYVTELCLSLPKPVNGKRMLYNEISFYMLFLNNVCNEVLWQSDAKYFSFNHHSHRSSISKHNSASTPADWWVKSVYSSYKYSSSVHWGAAKKPFIQFSTNWVIPTTQCIIIISQVWVWMWSCTFIYVRTRAVFQFHSFHYCIHTDYMLIIII